MIGKPTVLQAGAILNNGDFEDRVWMKINEGGENRSNPFNESRRHRRFVLTESSVF